MLLAIYTKIIKPSGSVGLLVAIIIWNLRKRRNIIKHGFQGLVGLVTKNVPWMIMTKKPMQRVGGMIITCLGDYRTNIYHLIVRWNHPRQGFPLGTPQCFWKKLLINLGKKIG